MRLFTLERPKLRISESERMLQAVRIGFMNIMTFVISGVYEMATASLPDCFGQGSRSL